MGSKLFLKLAPERRLERHLVMTFALRQALEILQMPHLDLAQWLQGEIEKNPLLEMDRAKAKVPFVGDFAAPVTLHEHLSSEIRDHFSDPSDRKKAFELMHLLDEKGFLPMEVENSSVLSTLQSFDPPGIFARSLQESLLLQLKAKKLTHTLAYTLIDQCYEDLLHGRFSLLKKRLKTSELKGAIEILARLTFRPSAAFKEEIATPIIPDISIERTKDGWIIEVNEEHMPRVYMEEKYLSLQEEETLRVFKTQAKWLFRSLDRRRKLLRAIARILLCKQAQFLDQKGPLTPFTVKELAEKLEIHESTVSRALFGKYMATPRGILPFKALLTSDAESKNAKELLEKLIASENKNSPLTDDELASALKKQGFRVARRTIAKYRSKLKIGSAAQRKHC